MSSSAAPLPPGTRIGSLRIDRVLGQGAFAITYGVTDTEQNRSFALKEYLPRGLVQQRADGSVEPANGTAAEAFGEGLKRFLAEGRALAALEHRNVVGVHGVFEANGTAWMLMPWYRGEPLHALLQRGGVLTREEALALALPLLDALDYIHGKGLYHQDIKPANIFITQKGDPLLLDFGAATLSPATDGSGLGSEGYAAIEQSDPDLPIGPWTDIYGLAATLYRCVSGRIPPPATERRAALRAGAKDPLIPLPDLLPPGDHADVASAIEQGLALEPADRPQSVARWRRAFERSAGPERAKTEQREWLPRMLVGALAIALVAAIVYLLLPARERPEVSGARHNESPSARPAYEAPGEAARWQSALDADTPYGYRLFMQDFPQSLHSDQAVLHLQRLDDKAWATAAADGTRPAIEAYMAEFPGGLHEADARIRLEEIRLAKDAAARERAARASEDDRAWGTARTRRTISAIDSYISAWPEGRHLDEARTLRDKLRREADDSKAFRAAAKLNTIDAYRAYIAAFPNGRQVAAALEAIDDLTLRPGKEFHDCDGCPAMVVVPAGSFQQGSDASLPGVLRAETPLHTVTFARPFAIGVYEITFEQWDQCVAEGGCSTRPADNGWGRGTRPVIMVSWNDAQEFTAWLSDKTGQSYSLPSESQWEYAARAGEQGDWLGGSPAAVCAYGNIAGAETSFRWHHAACADGAALQTLPVGSLRPNAFGLYDVIGNVAEWTQDCMNLSYLDAPADGSPWGRGICSSHMTRGGSWFTGTRDIRLPARFNLKNGDRNDFTGFRVVRTVESQ